MGSQVQYEELEMSSSRRRHGTDPQTGPNHRTFARAWGAPGPGDLPYISVPGEDNSSQETRANDHVDQIVQTMEADEVLMQDNPVSEALRMEQLRCMPQALTMKRHIKAKLSKSVSKKSTRRPLSFTRQARYRLSMTFAKVKHSPETR